MLHNNITLTCHLKIIPHYQIFTTISCQNTIRDIILIITPINITLNLIIGQRPMQISIRKKKFKIEKIFYIHGIERIWKWISCLMSQSQKI